MAVDADGKDPLELIAEVKCQVDHVRRRAHSLLETVTSVQDPETLRFSVEEAVNDAYAAMKQLRGSGQELELTLESFRKELAEKGIADGSPEEVSGDAELVGAVRAKHCAAAREVLEARLGEIPNVAALDFDARRPSRPRPRDARSDAAAGSDLLKGAVERVQKLAGSSVQIRLMDASEAVVDPCSATQIRLDCPDTMTAVIALSSKGSSEPVRVVTFSTEEAEPNAWGSSAFLAHRRISALATRALGFYISRAQALAAPGRHAAACAEAIEDLLMWLCSYTDLFTAPCSATGCMLASDLSTQLLLPPLVRPYKVHRSKLQRMVVDPSAREPCHLHIVPFAKF